MEELHRIISGDIEQSVGNGKSQYSFSDIGKVLEHIQEELKNTLDGGKVSENTKNKVSRNYAAVRRLLLDFGVHFEDIILNPLFHDAACIKALKSTVNFDLDTIKGFLTTHVQDEDLQKLFTMHIPLGFKECKDLEGEEIEFVKQRFIRLIGTKDSTTYKRAFLLQAMKYMGYCYENSPLHNGWASRYGVNTGKFSPAFGIQQSTMCNFLSGDCVLGNATIMQIIDAISYYNKYESLDGFARGEQDYKYTKSLQPKDTYKKVGLTLELGRKHRSEVFFGKIGINITNISLDTIIDNFELLQKYTQGDHQKVLKIIQYLSDFLEVLLTSGSLGFNIQDLASVTGISRTRYGQVFVDNSGIPERIMLRVLMAVSNFNNNIHEFSNDIFEDYCSEVLVNISSK